MASAITTIYIDESGNLGFDFVKIGTTKYFIITALICHDLKTSQQINRIIAWTNKYQNSQHKKRKSTEIKGTDCNLKTKQYFYKHIKKLKDWELYTIIASKKKWHTKQKAKIHCDQFYDEIFIKLLEAIAPKSHTNIIIDLSKNKKARLNLETKISTAFPNKQLSIEHNFSYERTQLQATDLFCWGIAKKYETLNEEWYQIFKEKITKEVLI